MLEAFDPGWFEEPVRSPQIDDLAFIASKLPFPIAAGEGVIRQRSVYGTARSEGSAGDSAGSHPPPAALQK